MADSTRFRLPLAHVCARSTAALFVATLAVSDVHARGAALETVALVQAPGIGVGGMVINDHRAYLLFEDGTATRSSGMPPDALDPVAASRDDPKNWGRWSIDAGTLRIAWNDGKASNFSKWWRAKPARSGDRLEGVYRSIGGGGNTALGGATMVAAWPSLEFERDGSYVSGHGAGASYPGLATSSRSGDAGRYAIDGYTITLTGADGKAQRTTFFFYPDGPDGVGIGNRVLSRRT
jgi:hypothetical protein